MHGENGILTTRVLQIIGKHGILSLFFFTQPVAAALRQLEAVVDVSTAQSLVSVDLTRTNTVVRVRAHCGDPDAEEPGQHPVQHAVSHPRLLPGHLPELSS
jgi:hypothetical protein